MRLGRGKKRVLAVLCFLAVSAGPAYAQEASPNEVAQVDYGTGVGKKLGRGLANVAFGWVDILKGIESVGEESGSMAGITWGPVYGTGNAIVRTLAGVYEVGTFPIPHPANFEPLVRPEFVLSD